MIEWILTDNNSSIFELIIIMLVCAILVAMFVFAFSDFGKDLKTKTREKIVYSLLVIWMSLMFSMIYIDKHIVTENVTEGDWVQIYSNDLKADISLHLEYSDPIKAGEVLTDNQLANLKEIYSRNAIRDVTVIASKEDAEEYRLSQIDGRNIELPLDKNTRMKITKVEYQKIVGQRKTLLGHHGDTSYSSKLDGQIRITVDGEKYDESLKELFDGKKQ